jgi:TolB-like protein/DNA-binding winged helix-turn-helix (wHTH) protein/Tfp pilus assembly protein PilF
MQAEPPYRTIRFGVFDLDLSAHELHKRGVRVKLHEQPFQVLALLLERKGELVTREELHARLWPADSFVDFDHGLGTVIHKLREALGDSADNPRFIETMPRLGFRFIASVGDSRSDKPPSEKAAPAGDGRVQSLEAGEAREALLWRRSALVTIFLVLLAIGSPWLFRRKNGPFQPPPGAPVLAVLPFVNLGSDPQNEYFSDGLTEEIIQSVGLVEGLEVTSRTSSFALKGTRLDVHQIASKLSATVLLEGTVRRAGDQLRVTAQLIRATDGKHIWSSTYDREMQNVFAIQQEIAASIANALRLKLGAGQRHYTDNLEAYDLYLRGRYALERNPDPKRSAPGIASEYFEQAIAKDAKYALAYAGAADAFVAMHDTYLLPYEEAHAKAKAAAERALELDPMLSETHAALGSIYAREYTWPEAERSLRRAIELNRNNALAHQELGVQVLAVQGRFEEGFEEVRRAVALDPLSANASREFAEALLWAGRYKEAEEQARRSVVLDPTRPTALLVLARALYSQGRIAEALTRVQEYQQLGGVNGLVACDYTRAGQREQALHFLQENLQGKYPPLPVPSRRLALIYVCLADKEHAFEYLGKMSAEHESGLPAFLVYPELAWLRSDSRFGALRQKIGIAPSGSSMVGLR